MSPNAPEQLMEWCMPTVEEAPGHCRGRAGCSSSQQDAAAATAMPCSLARDQCSTHVSLASAVPPRPWTPHVSALLHVVLLENWSSGTALSPVEQCVGEEMSSYSKEKPWTRACPSLGPLALHGTFQGLPLSLNSPNYLCSCRLLGEPEGLG